MKKKIHDPDRPSYKYSWFDTASNLVTKAKDVIETKSNSQGLCGVSSGFRSVDYLTSGWQPGNLIILAARPGMGRMSLALSMVYNISIKESIPLAYFSMDISSLQLITRLMAMEVKLSTEKLRTGKVTKEEWGILNSIVDSVSQAPLYISDKLPSDISEFRKKVKCLIFKGIKIIVVDRLQLLDFYENATTKNQSEVVSKCLDDLKSLAIELNIPILLLSDVLSSVEDNEGIRRPLISDLQEYKIIRQYTDVIMFLYRPEYYKIEYWDDEDGSSTSNQSELIIAWNRNGSLGNVRLKFNSHLGSFENLDQT